MITLGLQGYSLGTVSHVICLLSHGDLSHLEIKLYFSDALTELDVVVIEKLPKVIIEDAICQLL